MGIKFEMEEPANSVKRWSLKTGETFRFEGQFFIMTISGAVDLKTGEIGGVLRDDSVERVDILMRLA